MVFVAFAGMGGTPMNRRAGNAMKLPPPATEFRAPPSAPATKRKRNEYGVKQLDVSETSQSANRTHAQRTRSCRGNERYVLENQFISTLLPPAKRGRPTEETRGKTTGEP